MIYFVGAGPGDVDLITVKGRRLIERADVIIYAGSLVDSGHLDFKKAGARVYNSATMHLEEVLEMMVHAHEQGEEVVRLHTGDPAIYGAIQEQIDALKACEIPLEVVPGVSSFSAAAATIEQELTLPGVSQTVILTRRAGRTPVPSKESIDRLAKHGATMCLFLSAGQAEALSHELKSGYDEKTPVAVVYKATWEEEKVLWSTVGDLAKDVAAAGITKHAQIIVGEVLNRAYEKSKLYDKHFTTEYRKGIQ